MQTHSSLNWWAIWAKRLVLACLIGLLCFVGGHGALLIFGLTWEMDPFRVAVFGLGSSVHVGAVVALSEAKRIRSGGLVALSVVGLLVGAGLDGRFAAEHILSAESGMIQSAASADAWKNDADSLADDVARRQAEIETLQADTARMDTDGDGANDHQVRANRLLLADLSRALADKEEELGEVRRQVREATAAAAVSSHARSVSLRLTDGMDERRKILAFWGVGAVVMLLVSGIIAAGTWFVGLMSHPEMLRHRPVSGPPTGPDGGTREPVDEEDELPVDETGLGFRKDRARTPVWNRRVNGSPVYLRLPAGLDPEDLRRVVHSLNIVADAAETHSAAPRLRVVK